MTPPRLDVLWCRAVLFDLDGVLVDSTARSAQAWTAWAIQHGLDADRILRLSPGRRTIDTIRAVAPHLDADREARAVADLGELGPPDVALEGAADLLRQLPLGSWAVVTSAPRLIAVASLRSSGLPVPAVVVGGDDVEAGKPNPTGYLVAAERLGVRADDCVVIEDSPAGIRAGRAAGAAVLAVGTTHPLEALMEADALVPSLRMLTSLATGAWIELRCNL